MEFAETDISKIKVFLGASDDLYNDSSDWTSWLQALRDVQMVMIRMKNEQSPDSTQPRTPSPKSKEYLLFQSSEPYRDAMKRCSSALDRLDRQLDVLCEELDVCLQAQTHAKEEQIKARVKVKLNDAMHKADATSDMKQLHISSRLATIWTDTLRELKSKTIDCEKTCSEVKASISEKEQEVYFLEHATPDQFMEYLRVRKVDEDEDDDEDDGRTTTVSRISDEAKSSVLEQVARIDQKETSEQ